MAQPAIQGLDEMEADLMSAIDIITEAAADGMEEQATRLTSALKAAAPVYAGPETHRSDGSAIIKGALRDSIHWHWVGSADRQFETRGEGQFGRQSLRLVVVAGSEYDNQGAFYVRWVEFGTVNWGGNPFFFVTYRNMRRSMRSNITRKITASIKKINDL